MSMDEERRAEVVRLLRDGLDPKLMKGCTGGAAAKLEEAHREATREPEFVEPWPSLTAYRLAHVLLRSACSTEKLGQIKELFERADKHGHIGPLPRIYQLAVLHRLRSLTPGAISEEAIQSAFDQAVDGLRGRAPSPGPLERSRGEAERRFSDAARKPIQDSALNLLEFAAYFLGLPYEPLTGCGPFDDLQLGSSAWVLVGRDPITRTVRYPEHLARVELDARGAANPQAVLFELLRSGHGQWRVGAGDWVSPRNGTSTGLLCGLLVGFPKVEALRTALGVSSPENFRQLKKRLKEDLSELTGRPQEDLLKDVAAGQAPRLAPEIDVYGVVEATHPVLRGAPG